MAVALTGCGSSKRASRQPAMESVPTGTDSIRSALLAEGSRWVGVPYRYGGQSRDGVDCSGLVCVLMRDVAGVLLPRTAAQQQAWCQPLDSTALQPGDLVFFAPDGQPVNHVGIYAGARTMLHTGGTGVGYASLDDNYFRSNYHSAGRVHGLKQEMSNKNMQADTLSTRFIPAQDNNPTEARLRVLQRLNKEEN